MIVPWMDVSFTEAQNYWQQNTQQHQLLQEYSETLKVLQDQALKRTRKDEVEQIFMQDFQKSHKGKQKLYEED